MSKADPSCFRYQKNNELGDIITTHVDEFLRAGNEPFFKDTISKIREKFTVGKNVILLFATWV